KRTLAGGTGRPRASSAATTWPSASSRNARSIAGYTRSSSESCATASSSPPCSASSATPARSPSRKSSMAFAVTRALASSRSTIASCSSCHWLHSSAPPNSSEGSSAASTSIRVRRWRRLQRAWSEVSAIPAFYHAGREREAPREAGLRQACRVGCGLLRRDHPHHFQALVAVAPFVVVPADQLDEAVVQGDA